MATQRPDLPYDCMQPNLGLIVDGLMKNIAINAAKHSSSSSGTYNPLKGIIHDLIMEGISQVMHIIIIA